MEIDFKTKQSLCRTKIMYYIADNNISINRTAIKRLWRFTIQNTETHKQDQKQQINFTTMKEFKLSSQNEHIKAIEKAFESYSVAIQLREKLDINIKRGKYSSTINFTVKDNQDINPIDFFWIGFMVRQDYL